MKKWEDDGFVIEIASDKHGDLAEGIGQAMSESAAQRGTGIGGRTPEFIRRKMRDHRAIIATSATGEWAGFCYYDVYEGGKYVSQSGLIVAPQFRGAKAGGETKDYSVPTLPAAVSERKTVRYYYRLGGYAHERKTGFSTGWF